MSRVEPSIELSTLPRLVGAALALGADRVGPVSKGEQDLCRSVEALAPTPAERRSLQALISDGFDPLGEAFCHLRSRKDRRDEGATYTPSPIVNAMAEWAAQGPPPGRVIDPGSGSGRFAVAAAVRFPRAEIVGIELDPIAALLSRANLATRKLERRARVLVADYRAYSPGPSDDRTLYIGNPPYVRHHRIDPGWKEWLTVTARSHGLVASQLSGLHVHFLLATAVTASPGDRGIFITSSEWLDVNYGAMVRELLLNGLGGQAIHVIAPDVAPFDDAQTTGTITCFEVGSNPRSLRLRLVKRLADLGSLRGGKAVRRARLTEARRWTPLLRATPKVPNGHIQLGDICRVHRGAVTGANRVWVVEGRPTDVPERFVFPAVTRARELFAAGDSLSSTDWLRGVIDLPADLEQVSDEERVVVRRFLARAKRHGAQHGYVATNRQAWWSIGLREPAPLLASYMARRPPAIVRNLAGARHINIAHGLYPRQPLSAPTLDRLADVLRRSIHLDQGRTYAGGLTKFEPKEMERLLIPDVTQPSG
jgi:adenine-specific DNA-methyltransferase